MVGKNKPRNVTENDREQAVPRRPQRSTSGKQALKMAGFDLCASRSGKRHSVRDPVFPSADLIRVIDDELFVIERADDRRLKGG